MKTNLFISRRDFLRVCGFGVVSAAIPELAFGSKNE
ncbi:hypothetical protein ES707_21564 [subsurface metagenome]